MRKASLVVGLATFLVACGGQVGAPDSNDDGSPAPSSAPASEADGRPADAPAAKGPEQVAEGVGAPSALALSKDAVVFTTRSTMFNGALVDAGGLFVADKRVGPALMIAIDRQGATYDALALDEHDAFVATSDARVVRVPLAGGTATEIARLDDAAVALATAGDYVYFARESGEVGRVFKDGGAFEPLATVAGVVRSVQADESAVYVATAATDGAPSAAGILQVSLTSHETTLLASSNDPCALVRGNGRLFWTSQASADGDATMGEVSSLALAGGAVTKVASGSFAACAIASDEQDLFFATARPNAMPVRSRDGAVGLGLMRAPIAGGEPAPILEATNALAQPGAVAVDDGYLYWLTEKAVLRLRK